VSSGGAGGGQKPVSEGHRGDTHTPDRQITENLSSGNGVARLPGRNFGQKAQKGPKKKNFWPNFG